MDQMGKRNTNFKRYTDGPIFLFRFIGIDFAQQQGVWTKLWQCFTVTNIIVGVLHQIAYLVWCDGSPNERSAAISYINYYLVGLGKICFTIYNRTALARYYNKLRRFCPTAVVERKYQLQGYLKTYRFVEKFLWNFFRYIYSFYICSPVVVSFYELWRSGHFGFKTPVLYWHPLKDSVPEYVLYFVQQFLSSFSVSVAILSCDTCLFGSISLLCLNYDFIAQKVIRLQPQQAESVKKLKQIVRHHQEVLSMSRDINHIFTPSIIFSLLSSSFIICFAAYQMLNDVPVIFIVKALAMLLYEMKQVIITCYFGDKLIEKSSNLFDVIYMHNWYEGSVEYRRLVLFMMTRTLMGSGLKVAGIADVSLITLKQVFSMSYQTFAVLKTV